MNQNHAGLLVAVVPLPPGMSLDEWLALRKQLIVIGITTTVAAALTVWDYCVLFVDEWKIYRNNWQQAWKMPTTWAFILLRYSALLAFITPIWFTLADSLYCGAIVVIAQTGLVLVTASAGIIFYYRVVALWDGWVPIRIGVGALYLFVVTCWIAAATQFHAKTESSDPTVSLSDCQIVPVPSWVAISYASSVLFDVSVVLLSALKLYEIRKQSPVARQVYMDGMRYFVIATTANIIVLAIQSLPSSHQALKPAAMPFATLMTSTIAQRVFINLKLFNTRHAKSESRPSIGGIVAPEHPVLFANSTIPFKSKAGSSLMAQVTFPGDV